MNNAPTLGQRLNIAALGLALCFAIAALVSLGYLNISLMALFERESLQSIFQFLGEFFPPDFSPDWLEKITHATVETLAISALSTLLAGLIGLALALPAAHNVTPFWPLRSLTRFILNLLRSVPELVWATLTVLAAGLGPFAGTLALALHTAGVLGRLFAEALENVPPYTSNALIQAGARPSSAFFYGTLPQVFPQWVAYTLYRWEINVRMATVLGFVGAGGLGQLLYVELSLFHQAQACTVILAMLILAMGVDQLSHTLRRQLAPR